MDRAEVRSHLYQKYIAPTEGRQEKSIGIEIEMPVVRLEEGPTDYAIAQQAMAAAVDRFGFRPDKLDDNGVCFSATRPDNGDNISFDCSYNNLELSLGKETAIGPLDRRFREYVGFLNQCLGERGHALTGMGINPRNALNRRDFIPSERYRMLERFLQGASRWQVPMFFHPYVAFGSFASASQVQLDVNSDRLVETLRAFNNVEPVKAVLFSNALLEAEPDLLCVRDLLWENSTHGINPHNIGMYDCPLTSVDDLLEYISTTSIFCTERQGRYINFKPLPITEYLEAREVQGEYYEQGAFHPVSFEPRLEDLAYLRTYKFEDLTFRGTIEFRSCCCQPLGEAMTVAAFHVGLMDQVEGLNKLLDDDRVLYHHGYSATELRKILNRRQWPEFVDPDGLRGLCLAVLDLAREGLEHRGLGEEVYLAPLLDRARQLRSPGRAMADALDKGVSLRELITRYGAL